MISIFKNFNPCPFSIGFCFFSWAITIAPTQALAQLQNQTPDAWITAGAAVEIANPGIQHDELTQDPNVENWTAKYQSTYNWQMHRRFGVQYSGANSIQAGGENMFTFSTTAHWGARVWGGGELYFDPELVSGVPFSGNLVGLGGFTNGEITRASGPNLLPYVQRFFLRQTWGQGGARETVNADFNQLAGQQDKNRWVLTVGNFSTLDVFDDNPYAKDPRTQFMNWGNWTYAAYDYAADARGYGWGVALESYRGDWVWRIGRMTGPKVPNGLPVDFNLLKHYGDQIELEHVHQWWGNPGHVRLLVWHDRAVLASFSDATNFLLSHPGSDPETILNVRMGEKNKSGLGLNVDQSLTHHAGYFFRAMVTDGRSETYAFTEADHSLSTGLVSSGALWQRPQDHVGASLMVNGLSEQRKTYLKAGGISFFIGDGALSYQNEKIVEGFYSWGLSEKLWFTLDYQHIQNPAYNAARGPIDVMAFRLHAEY
jgi:high affinity Mn2+ porin